MAQHEKCFAGSVLHGSCVLAWIAAGQLCILRGSNLNHPRTLQRSWSTPLLGARAAPRAVSHLKPLPHFTDFLWELCRQPHLQSVRKTPFGHFWRHFLGTAKTQNIWADFENCFFPKRHKQAKFGQFCIFGAVFCGSRASRKIHFLALKKSKRQIVAGKLT